MRKVYSLFDPPPREYVGGGKSLTDDSFADSCDIHKMLKRYLLAGEMPQGNPGAFVDVAMLPDDFLAAQVRVKAAETAFMELPSDLRARFKNSPVELLSFLANPANVEEARELGLFVKPEVPEKEPAGSGGAPPGDPPGS